ncbi:MAG: hypothetical protein IT536_04455 [Hyphomicrobiales bacterium]|nr:hypothetical protein [Hyphomicrobiales bacterium]
MNRASCWRGASGFARPVSALRARTSGFGKGQSMGFVAKAFGATGSGDSAQTDRMAAENRERLAKIEAENQRQARLVSDERAKADKVAAAQQRLRLGRPRGLLRYSEPSTDVLGASGV